ncbi:hypothetical protein NJB14197_10570 [Mycobacterium montefiorense]|nr:hypothetical protein NJB14191_14620 [Mycobacterium montefiorense]GKU55188.1 hypothetical protein NJB14197_10570 [Mycobacterium montefiorense]GLE50450.1 hypothetical protein ATCCBAA256_00440 [Mycobacterium montefiorense]
MPARAEGGIDEYGAGSVGVLAGQCRGEQFDAALQQHRHMPEAIRPEIIWLVSHRNTSPGLEGHVGTRDGPEEGRPCTEVPVRSYEPGVGEVRQGRFGQRPRCTGMRLR